MKIKSIILPLVAAVLLTGCVGIELTDDMTKGIVNILASGNILLKTMNWFFIASICFVCIKILAFLAKLLCDIRSYRSKKRKSEDKDKSGNNSLSVILLAGMLLFGGGVHSPVAVADDRGDLRHRGYIVSYPLIHATFHNDIAEVKRLLDGGANPNAMSDFNWTAFIFAVLQGNAEIVKMMLSVGANPNAADDDGRTALMYATQHGHAEVAKMLLAAGANPNAADDDGRTVLMYAAQHAHTEVAKMLLSSGANPNASSNNGETVLMMAERLERTETIAVLQNFRPSVSPEEYIAGLQAEYCGDIATIECQENYISPEEPAEEIAEEPAEPETKTVCRAFANGINPDNTEWGRIGASEAGVGETEYAAIRAAIRICENDGLTECQTDLEVECEEVAVQ